MSFLVSHTCEIRFHDVIVKTLDICIPMQKLEKKNVDLHGQMSMFWTLINQFNSLDSVT